MSALQELQKQIVDWQIMFCSRPKSLILPMAQIQSIFEECQPSLIADKNGDYPDGVRFPVFVYGVELRPVE